MTKSSLSSALQNSIIEIVAAHSPLDLSLLPKMYKARYKLPLDHKKHGFSKLKGMLETMPCIMFGTDEMNRPIISVRPGSKNASSQKSTASRASRKKESVEPEARKKVAVDVQDEKPILPDGFGSFYEFATKKSKESDNEAGNTEKSFSTMNGNSQTYQSLSDSRLSIGDEEAAQSFEEMALLGHIDSSGQESTPQPVFINTHIPFCMATIGVQGAGKSHTLGCFLESCLVPDDTDDVVRLKKSMTALVLHYDQSTTSICEAAGLLSPCRGRSSTASPSVVPRAKAVVLVSPTYYKQRKEFYGDYCTVRPLLFRWSSLTADHIKRVMRIKTGDNQLYVASFMTLLRGYQRRAVVPDFSQFIQEVKDLCNISGQSGPLDQRIALLESMMAESEVNQDIVEDSIDISKALSSDLSLIIIDMTDPLLSREEANSVFQVVTEQFRSFPVEGGKLLALDEAHKFMDGIKSDGLSEAIVNVARLMRHDGIRLAVSTQSPKALAPELLELVSIAVLHHFHSQDWWTYIRQKLPLGNDAFEDVLHLAPGNALVFASRHNFDSHITNLRVRPRLTADFGASRTNQ